MIQLEMKVGINIQQKFNRKTEILFHVFTTAENNVFLLSDTGINFLFGKKLKHGYT